MQLVFLEGGKTLSLNLEEKKAVIAELGAVLVNAQTVVVAEYRGIGVVQMTTLRAKARANGVYLRVLKNTLARRAVSETAFAGLADHLVGPLAYGISKDPVAAAKVLADFAKTNDITPGIINFFYNGGTFFNSFLTLSICHSRLM